jgi:hypothetical protein
MMEGDPPSYFNGRPNPPPGFSDSKRSMDRKPSLLRRSVAFMTGNDVQSTSSYPQQQLGVGNGVVPARKKSLLRRSMAFLSGRPAAPIQGSMPIADSLDSPMPRVLGFEDEKPKNRKSEYLGASGAGDEWDFSGSGAKFWKRFSVAQRLDAEGANKDSQALRAKTSKRNRWISLLSLLGGILIIAAVIAIIVWRENVKSSDIPGAIDREFNGVNGVSTLTATTDAGGDDTTYVSQTDYGTTEARPTTTSSSRHHHHTNDNRKRRDSSPQTLVDQIKRQIETPSHFYGGIHPLPRGNDIHMVRVRKHADRSLAARATPAPLS